MKSTWTAVVVLCSGLALGAGPSTAPAVRMADTAGAPPASQPATRPTPFGNRLIRLRDLGLAGANAGVPSGQLSEDPDEWAAIAEFCKANLPNRWKLFETIQSHRGENAPLVVSLRERFVSRYRLLMNIQGGMPDLYEAAVKQGRLEDDAWEAVVAYRKKRNDPALTTAMRKSVGALVKNLLDEKQERLKILQQTLADEQKSLESDRENVDDLIDRQIAFLSSDEPVPRLSRFGGFGPGGGGFGGGGRGFDRPPPGSRFGPSTRP